MSEFQEKHEVSAVDVCVYTVMVMLPLACTGCPQKSPPLEISESANLNELNMNDGSILSSLRQNN